MKRIRLIRYTVIILAFLSCKIDKTDIIVLLGSKQKYKPVSSKTYGYQNGFCSGSLSLNSDSTFLNESGCEGRSYVTIGTWKLMNDSIELNAYQDTQLYLISNIESSSNNNNFKTTFFIFDKAGRPVSNFIIFPIKKLEKYSFLSNAGVILNSTGKMVESYKTNNSGFVNVDISECDTLIFSQLEHIANRKFRFSTKSLPDSIRIYVDANKSGLQYSDVKYNYWKRAIKYKVYKQRLLNGDDSLIEINHD
jgi:hypothetical protein